MRSRSKPRSAFRHFCTIQTRWADNDQYGHVNNVAYYAFFDTAVNAFLIAEAGLKPVGGGWMGLVVETGCAYFAPAAYPETLEVGLAIETSGRTSQRYEIGVFRPAEATAIAQGHFVHVYVDAATRRPITLPDELKVGLAKLAGG